MIGSLYKRTDLSEETGSLVVSRAFCLLAAMAGVFFVAATLYGVWLNYSPVPFSDSWEGIVAFYLRSLQDSSAWWHQHYDHRIFFSKLLFWLDMHYFGGHSLLLIPLNVVLMLAICWTLYRFAFHLLTSRNLEIRLLVLASLAMLSLSWIQRQNITWEFQSQFYLVYLLPMLSFFALARSTVSGSRGWALASVVLGVCAAFSMANGIFALPILAVLTGVIHRSWRRAALVALIALACIWLFFHGYEETPGRKFGPSLLLEHPFKVIGYALAYLGNPFYWIFGRIEVAIAAGAGAVLISLYLLISPPLRRSPFALALIAYVFFIFCTAGITAFGRSLFNIELAASSRYTTPALSMWGALLVLSLARWQVRLSLEPAARMLFVLIVVLLTGQQLRALYFDDPNPMFLNPHSKALMALGLQMGIDDPQIPSRIFPFASPDEMRGYFAMAREAQVSIFNPDSASPANSIGQSVESLGVVPCEIESQSARIVDPTRNASLVQGKLGSTDGKRFRQVLFVDQQHRVIGVALLGRSVLNSYSRSAGRKLFDGYVLGTAQSQAFCR